MLGPPLRGAGELLGALCLVAGELGVLLGGLPLHLSLADLLERPRALLLGILRPRERRRAVSLRLLGPGQRLLRLLARPGRGGLGRRLRGRGGVRACKRVLGCALGFLRSRLLVGFGGGAQRRLGRLVRLHPLALGGGLVLGGVRDLRLRVSAHRGQLRLELLGVGQHAECVASALQIRNQARGYVQPEYRHADADLLVAGHRVHDRRAARGRPGYGTVTERAQAESLVGAYRTHLAALTAARRANRPTSTRANRPTSTRATPTS